MSQPQPTTSEAIAEASEAEVVSPAGTPAEELLHPLDAHAIRAPLPKTAGIWAVVLTEDEAKAEAVAESLRRLIGGRGRPLKVVIEPDKFESRADRLARAMAGADLPIVLLTTATEPWTEAHLKPLLEAIDRCDLVLGRRRRSLPGRVLRWLAARPWALLFAIPLRDVHSPCRLSRREALEQLPPQSASRFLDVELLAKSSFFAQLVDEEDVPPLAASAGPPGFWGDFVDVFRRPVLRREPPPAGSAPAEDPQGDEEGGDRPDGEDDQVRPDPQEPGPLEDHPA
ncbi:hypothetical protein [Tautonia sociabilis]|uniref:Uncharacterized protein n=1 Tax=Tautonia sociabilis TaxID=2080755 RepID=A0A432MQ79_9BACT|nr:hypothetical protein [Tautonia sociabilis]RUL89215.1 hypothetical protein TsocGM_03615 [Tautonia sociabilis]